LGEQHPEYAKVLTELGAVYGALHNRDRGEALVKEGGRILADRLGAEHPEVAAAAIHLAGLYAADHPAEAEQVLRQAAADLAERVAPGDRRRLEALVAIGELCLAEDKPEQARAVLDEALVLMQGELLAESPLYRQALKHLADAEQALQRFDAAASHAREWAQATESALHGAPEERLRSFARIASEIDEGLRR
jgi:hypothetical protein